MSDFPIWLDGRLLPPGRAVLRADDNGRLEGRGCYTTARIERGRPRWPERHARRLRGDARALGLGEIAEDAVAEALAELGKACFGQGEGVVRLQAFTDPEEALHLLGTARALGPEPDSWRAAIPPFPHPGPAPWGGAKISGQLLYTLARAHAREAKVDECLLFDRHDRLVEGARSNLFFVDAAGALAAPDLALGAVEGIAQQLLREHLPTVKTCDLRPRRLGELRELLAVNAVRGARPILAVDAAPVGDGTPGPWSRRLSEILAAA